MTSTEPLPMNDDKPSLDPVRPDADPAAGTAREADERLDDALQAFFDRAMLPVPDGFATRALGAIRKESVIPAPWSGFASSRVAKAFRWLAIAGSVGVGIAQLAAFAFGLWVTTNAWGAYKIEAMAPDPRASIRLEDPQRLPTGPTT